MGLLRYLFLLVLLCTCSRSFSPLEEALVLAGENRKELEKVLEHYAQNPADSVKWQAARFLIENMPGHYTAEGGLIDVYRNRIDRDSADFLTKKILDIWVSHYFTQGREPVKKEDVQHVTADYLIRHIDACFEIYEGAPWYEDVTREDFFHYLLPYRVSCERLDLWRDSLRPVLPEKYRISSDVQYSMQEARKCLQAACPLVIDFSDTLLVELTKRFRFECLYLNLQEVFYKRALGIPVAVDYFPHYPNRNGGHYWTEYINSRKREPFVYGAPQSRPAKIFRETYVINRMFSSHGKEYVPEFFKNPFILDVTDEYLYTHDVCIVPRNDVPANSQHAYLCVFNNLKWQPAAIGIWQKGKACFDKMGAGIVYLPVYYEQEQMRAFNYPFVLKNSGEIKYLIPDTNRMFTVKLERKYPYDELQYEYSSCLTACCIEASNDKNFAFPDTIFRFPAQNHYYFMVENEKLAGAYRYWRMVPSERAYIAELLFCTPQGKRLEPFYISKQDRAFDGNILTSAFLDTVWMDFGKPELVSRVVCLPRSDGNGIYPGNEYELFYYSEVGWCSLGRKEATGYSLDYEIPANALYWLRNRTTGIEERVFTVNPIDGQVRFW